MLHCKKNLLSRETKMKIVHCRPACCLILTVLLSGTAHSEAVKPAPNGIEIPKGYKDWQLISVSHREDNKSIRAILGNSAAIKAARAGNTNPWPDGAILAKLVWKDSKHPNWDQATVPGKLIHTEFMIKDSKKFDATGGWGFARWKGMNQEPYGKDASFVQECFGCHTPVKDADYVFTKLAPLP